MHRVARAALTAVFVSFSAAASAQDALAPVRTLYASAEYEQALSAIGRIRTEAGVNPIEADRYQVLCLVALGRPNEARQAIESIVKADPLFLPAAGDTAPSVRAVYTEVRRKLLPALGRQMYADAKAALDRKAFSDAVEKFDRTLRVINDPDAAGDAGLGDLRVLVAGFLDLSKSSAAPVAAVAPEKPSTPEPVAPPPPAAAPVITAPVPIRQAVPKWEGIPTITGLRPDFRGAVEVDIDEGGNVVAATIAKSIHPNYDPRLLEAARDWKYEPALRDGKPMRIVKRVEIVLRD